MFMLLLCGLKIHGLTTTTTPQQKLRKKSSLENCVLKVLKESTKESK